MNDQPREFIPDRKAHALERARRRVDKEMHRRIQAKYSLQDQNFLIVSLLAKALGHQGSDEIEGVSSEKYQLARDTVAAPAFVDYVVKHRQAAGALYDFLNRNQQSVNTINVADDKWWPADGAKNEQAHR